MLSDEGYRNKSKESHVKYDQRGKRRSETSENNRVNEVTVNKEKNSSQRK